MSRAKTKHVGLLVTTLLLTAAAIWLITHRQFIIDQVIVWQYQPSAEVEGLATRSKFNEQAMFLYRASQPTIEGTQRFNAVCGNSEQHANILGCYTNNRIYIYNVASQQLDGIREVTASHEMLHAAYERLSSVDRSRVDSLLEAEYAHLKTDAAFSKRMAFYESSEPGQRDNELHSIIGTEVADISPQLETYYKRYFTDRSQVTGLHAKYAEVFTSLESRAASLSSQLTQLGTTIEQQTAAYNEAVALLNDAISSFNTRASNGGFSTESQFTAERAKLLAQANELSLTRMAVNDQISTYQSLRDELQSLALESKALNNSIDSSLAPAPSL